MVITSWKERPFKMGKEPLLWESSWIDFLCSKIPDLRRVRSELKSGTEPLILIISDNGKDKIKSEQTISFIEKSSRKRLIGIFHLSDEWFLAPLDNAFIQGHYDGSTWSIFGIYPCICKTKIISYRNSRPA
jgi:hypothetical protein